MKSALGFGSLKIHKRKQSGNEISAKQSTPASPLSPVVQVQPGQPPACEPPATRIRIDAAAFNLAEDVTPEVDQWCKASQRFDVHGLAGLVERSVAVDQELDAVCICLSAAELAIRN